MFTFKGLPDLPEMLLVHNDNVFTDHRGVFYESYREEDFAVAGIPPFVQGNISKCGPYVLRGMHYQVKSPQGKFIRVLTGGIFDVAVDLRRGSPNFGKWAGVSLRASSELISGTAPSAIYVPPGFAHGFLALETGATVLYETTTYHDPELDRTLHWADPGIDIKWPTGRNMPLILSEKDRRAPRLADIKNRDLFK